MSEDKLRAAAERGRRMRDWAEGEDGLFTVFAAVRNDYLKTLVASDIADSALREKVYHRVAALNDLETVMRTVITAGHGAVAAIQHMAKVAEKKKRVKKNAE